MNVTILGAGAFGTALAKTLQEGGQAVTVWGHDAGFLTNLRETRCNERHLPGIPLPPISSSTARPSAGVVVSRL